MKNETYFKNSLTAGGIVAGFTVVIGLLMLSACGKSSVAPPTPVEKNTQLLASNTWKIQTVQADGVDKSSAFAGMTLKFASSGYTAVSGNVVWPATGTWSFTDATATAFTRDDGVQVTITTLTATSLQVKLSWTKTTLGGGRINSVAGQYVFTFTN